MFDNIVVHVLTVSTIVQFLSIALEVSIKTLFDAVKQQYENGISTNEYWYSDEKAKKLLVFTYKLLGNLVCTNNVGNDNQS